MYLKQDLEKMTVAELKAIADGYGVTTVQNPRRRAPWVEAILEAQQAAPAPKKNLGKIAKAATAAKAQTQTATPTGSSKYWMWAVTALLVLFLCGASSILLYRAYPVAKELVVNTTPASEVKAPEETPAPAVMQAEANSKALDAAIASMEAANQSLASLLEKQRIAASASSNPEAKAPVTDLQGKDIALDCPTTEQAQGLIGLKVARIGTEPCAWTWRAVDLTSAEGICPKGMACTFHVKNDDIVFHRGIDQRADIKAGTWRWLKKYPEGECGIYSNEAKFAASEVPTFKVRYQPIDETSCQGAWLGESASTAKVVELAVKPPSAESSAPVCKPPSAKWERVTGGGCGWILKEGLDTISFERNFRLDTPDGSVQGPKTDLSVNSPSTLWDLDQ